jgi:hypothetical protein
MQQFNTSTPRIGRFKGQILKHAVPREVLCKGGRQVTFPKNNSDTYVSRRWIPYGAIDFGMRNPFCFLLGLIDPKDDTLWIVAEHYQKAMIISQHARHIKGICREWIPRTWDPDKRAAWLQRVVELEQAGDTAAVEAELPYPEVIWADPEDRQSRVALGIEQGVATTVAKKAIRAGINAVSERITPDKAGNPHIFISPECMNTIAEIEGYVWSDVAHKDEPKKQDDHAMDTLRYLAYGVKLLAGWGADGGEGP